MYIRFFYYDNFEHYGNFDFPWFSLRTDRQPCETRGGGDTNRNSNDGGWPHGFVKSVNFVEAEQHLVPDQPYVHCLVSLFRTFFGPSAT